MPLMGLVPGGEGQLGGSPLSRGFSTGCPLPQLFPTSSTAPLVYVFVVRLLTVDDFLVFFALFLCNVRVVAEVWRDFAPV